MKWFFLQWLSETDGSPLVKTSEWGHTRCSQKVNQHIVGNAYTAHYCYSYTEPAQKLQEVFSNRMEQNKLIIPCCQCLFFSMQYDPVNLISLTCTHTHMHRAKGNGIQQVTWHEQDPGKKTESHVFSCMKHIQEVHKQHSWPFWMEIGRRIHWNL